MKKHKRRALNKTLQCLIDKNREMSLSEIKTMAEKALQRHEKDDFEEGISNCKDMISYIDEISARIVKR